MPFTFTFPYQVNKEFATRVAYFCMEYAIDQPLKLYAGGLGFLSGSHMRSAYQLKQNLVGIGILWKYGYYDQVRKPDQTMDVLFMEKSYGFLQPTNLKFKIQVSGADVWVTAFYLVPELFNTAPVFFLSTDLPENDYLAKTICYRLYDPNPETRIAAAILLGAGGAKLLELLQYDPQVYHLNESHALPLAFYLYKKYGNLEAVRRRLVYTNHTPEEAGNPKTDMRLLDKMGFFTGIPLAEMVEITGQKNYILDHTLAAMQFAGFCNAVSKMHKQTLQSMWAGYSVAASLISITNAQNYAYWADSQLYEHLNKHDDVAFRNRKGASKRALFELVSDQCGELFKEDILTLVFAKRFSGYKRADLLLFDMDRFERIVNNSSRPIQIIWAGKPYPMDYSAIGIFDKIVHTCRQLNNCAVLVGFELKMAKLLKAGADLWLNVPRITHEASGTSGMTAAMNGAINLSIPDGWFPEFARDGINSFVIPPANDDLPDHEQDEMDAHHLYDMLENEIIPMYYNDQSHWMEMIRQSMTDVIPQFNSDRMAAQYYEMAYSPLQAQATRAIKTQLQ